MIILNPTSNQTFRVTWTTVFLCGLRLFRAELSSFFFLEKCNIYFLISCKIEKHYLLSVIAQSRRISGIFTTCFEVMTVRRSSENRGNPRFTNIKRNSLLPCIKVTVNFCVVFHRRFLRESFLTCWDAIIPTAFVLRHDNLKRYRQRFQLESSFGKSSKSLWLIFYNQI